MMEWLDMSGDGLYVWPCYVLTVIVLLANLWVAKRHHRVLLSRAVARAGMAAGAKGSAVTEANSSETHQSQG